jgi:eukaryotic-like serine/threonine-protein kinase
MQPEQRRRWPEVKDLLHEAIQNAEPEERERYLRTRCAQDFELLDAVLSMLPAELGPFADQKFGRYHVRHRLGRGAVGDVYLANPQKPAGKRVAIKFLHPQHDDEYLRKRLEAEVKALSTLDHPNIVRFLDAGPASAVHPYFVMEYVEGQPITAYCATNGKTIRERLKLFLELLDAVAYVHRNEIIHRDLKPANVLVSAAEGRVKLLDFGIVKFVRPEFYGQEALTTGADSLFSPEYASPEQMRGNPVTTVSDVYSLGALLYELLAGKPPFPRGEKEGAATYVKRVLEMQPPKPSEAAATSELARELRGELDNIVLMALRKEPARRYISAESFAADVRAHLEDDLVKAQPDTFSYRSSKSIRRHRFGLAAAATVALSLIVGLFTAIHYARVADRQRQEAERHRDTAERRLQTIRELNLAGVFERLSQGTRFDTRTARTIAGDYRTLVVRVSNPDDRDFERWVAFASALYQQVGGPEAEAFLGKHGAARRGGLETVVPFAPDGAQLARDYETLSRVLSAAGDDAGATAATERAGELRSKIR